MEIRLDGQNQHGNLSGWTKPALEPVWVEKISMNIRLDGSVILRVVRYRLYTRLKVTEKTSTQYAILSNQQKYATGWETLTLPLPHHKNAPRMHIYIYTRMYMHAERIQAGAYVHRSNDTRMRQTNTRHEALRTSTSTKQNSTAWCGDIVKACLEKSSTRSVSGDHSKY